jgi:hypothetical protein
LNIAQKPIAACRGKQLKLRDQGTAVFAAHKQMFLGRQSGQSASRDRLVQVRLSEARILNRNVTQLNSRNFLNLTPIFIAALRIPPPPV